MALVGATGAGKTTTTHLLGRLYDIQRGKICFAGKDIRSYELEALRKQVGFVLQDIFLFSASLRQNITLYEEGISDSDIFLLSQEIGAGALLEELPGGLDYELAERGANLSMGQRQLISFLRVMCREARFIVLDEATASVDTQTEQFVQQAMRKLLKTSTMLVVAHRLSTILNSDNILVFDKGQIIEQGTHRRLMEKKGAYYRLYEMQYKTQEASLTHR